MTVGQPVAFDKIKPGKWVLVTSHDLEFGDSTELAKVVAIQDGKVELVICGVTNLCGGRGGHVFPSLQKIKTGKIKLLEPDPDKIGIKIEQELTYARAEHERLETYIAHLHL